MHPLILTREASVPLNFHSLLYSDLLLRDILFNDPFLRSSFFYDFFDCFFALETLVLFDPFFQAPFAVEVPSALRVCLVLFSQCFHADEASFFALLEALEV